MSALFGIRVFGCFWLQALRIFLRNHKPRSQAAFLEFIVQLENVIGKAQERPFDFDLDLPAKQEASEVHVLLHHRKDAFGLDAPIDAKKFALLGVDSLFHRFPLCGKAFGYIDDLVPLC